MNDEEFANYLANMKADHVIKMSALEEEAATLRKPVRKLDEKIAKENLIQCFANYAGGKNISKSEEMLRKMKISKDEDAARYFQVDKIDHSRIDSAMIEIENELNELLERISGFDNISCFTKELEDSKNDIHQLNDKKRKMIVELNRATMNLNKLGTQSRAPLEELGQNIKNNQNLIAKEFTKRSMACLSQISQFKANLNIPPVEELDVAEKALLAKRDNLQNLVDGEHRARQKCNENPDFKELVSEARDLLEKWHLLEARRKISRNKHHQK